MASERPLWLYMATLCFDSFDAVRQLEDYSFIYYIYFYLHFM